MSSSDDEESISISPSSFSINFGAPDINFIEHFKNVSSSDKNGCEDPPSVDLNQSQRSLEKFQ